jgi:Glycosyltransferase family 87
VEWYLGLYGILLASLTAFAWYIYYLKRYSPLKRPLFDKEDRFNDLMNYVGKIGHLKDGAAALAAGWPVYNYPAPAAYIYAFLLRGFPHHPVRVYLLILAAGLSCAAILLWRTARTSEATNWGLIIAIIATATIGSPMIFAADRANLEGAVGLILGTGLVLFAGRRYYGSAVLIGLAASIKPFPVLFLLLLLRKRRYREIAVGVSTAVCSTLLALTALGPTPHAAYRALQPGIKRYYEHYVINVLAITEERFEHSILDCLKVVGRAGTSERKMHAILLVSVLLGAVGFAFVLFRFFRLPTVNQMILLGVAITLFPPVAAEYTLLHLYVPFGVFLIFLKKDVGTGRVEFKLGCVALLLTVFALLFSPMTFLGPYAGASKTGLLLILLVVVGTFPMPSSIFNETDAYATAISEPKRALSAMRRSSG